jgi:Flp pilus assembly protein TadD
MRYSFVADHFQYLASLALIALVIGSAARVSLRWGQRAQRAGIVVGIVVLAALGVRTWQQTHIYRDLETLWRDTLAKNPTAVIAMNNLAAVLIEADRVDEAIPYAEQAVQQRPDDVKYHNTLAGAYLKAGRTRDALATFKAALESRPADILTHCNVAALYAQQGRAERAFTHTRRAVAGGVARMNSGDRITRANQQHVLQAWSHTAQYAVRKAERLQLRDQFDELATLLDETAPLLQEALPLLGDQVTRLMPTAIGLRIMQAETRVQRGDTRDALAIYRACLDLQPDAPAALVGLAWRLAVDCEPELRNGDEAVLLARRADALTPNDARVLDCLAAALAETGQFSLAKEVAAQAEAAARRDNDTALARAIHQRLRLYDTRTPYREMILRRTGNR